MAKHNPLKLEQDVAPMQQYTAALVEDKTGRFAMIKKNHGPDFMVGKVNLVGGKVALGELPIPAHIRELKEELNIDIEAEGFTLTSSIMTVYPAQDGGAMVHFARFVSETFDWKEAMKGRERPPLNDAGEEISICDPRWWAQQPIVPNLRWIIPLLQDPDNLEVHVQPFRPVEMKRPDPEPGPPRGEEE